MSIIAALFVICFIVLTSYLIYTFAPPPFKVPLYILLVFIVALWVLGLTVPSWWHSGGYVGGHP